MTPLPLLTWRGRKVRSPDDGPESSARKVPEAPLRPGSLFFVPSPLEGWGLDVLLDRLPDDGAVVVYDHDPDLEQLCRERWDDFMGSRIRDPRLFRLETDTEAAVQQLFSRLPLPRLRRCLFLSLNGAWLPHSQRYREIFARLDQGLARWWSNRVTEIHLGPLWVRNFFDNLNSPRFPGSPWPDWGDDPILVCGAGISLEVALPTIEPQRQSWRILAADTALPVLKALGIRPDGAVCVESQHANLRDFAGWLGADVPLFADLTSLAATSRIFGPQPHWFISEFSSIQLWNRWPWDRVPRLPPLGSVGVVAAWIAWKLTRGPVVLAGLDFSFPPGKTHAREAPTLSSRLVTTNRTHPMEQPGSWIRAGVIQGPRGWLTTPILEQYAEVLAERAGSEGARTWVWDDSGLPLGLPTWDSQDLPTLGSRPPSDLSGPSVVDPWLSQERERWETILTTFERLNANPEDRGPLRALEQQLKDVDYLTFHFPDPEFRPDSDWLIRAQIQVRWILGRLSPRLRS